MKQSSGSVGAPKRLRGAIGVARLFEASLSCTAAQSLRLFFMRLRLRVVGTFFMTFGIYTVIVTLIKHYFSREGGSEAAVYCGVCAALLALPLLLSEGNISTSLTGSRSGRTICKYLGLRREKLRDYKLCGTPNQGFVFGVLCGTLTFAFSPFTVLCNLAAAAGAGIILAVPETGLLFSCIGIMLLGVRAQGFLLAVTCISLALKLLRGKRYVRLRKRDICAGAVFLMLVGASVLSSFGVSMESAVSALLIAVYFAVVLLMRDCRKISRLMVAASVSGGLVSACYIVGWVLKKNIPTVSGFDSGFILSAVSSLPSFASGSAPTLLCVLSVLCAGLAVRPNPRIGRLTSVLCLASMLGCLLLCGGLREATATVISLVLLLVLLGRRSIYASLSAVFAGGIILSLCGGAGQVFYTFIKSCLASVFVPQSMGSAAGRALIAGSGFSDGSLFSADGAGGLYSTLLSAAGITGLFIFASFVTALVFVCAAFMRKTAHIRCTPEELMRFGTVRSAADMRMGAGAPLCAAISLLLCGLSINIWSSATVFMTFWLCCALASAYAVGAGREITKAENATEAAFSPETAAVDITSFTPSRKD